MYEITPRDSDRIFSAMIFFVFFLSCILLLTYIRRRRVEEFKKACKQGSLNTIQQMMNNHISVNTILGITGEEISVGLMWACSLGHVKIIERLLKEEKIYENRFSLASAFMCACKRGNVEVVELLIKEPRIPIDIVNKNGATPEQITRVPEIKSMVRSEHWRRIQEEINLISDDIQLTVQNIRTIKNREENSVFLEAVELKMKELRLKTEVLETAERTELDRLLARFKAEQCRIQSRYDEESRGIKLNIQDDILKLKALM
ncbi:uncharacterized protein LOC111702221 [Eurytemora carolleeae]|uniref:uncharacterized protein LOC111702221 n=1 Tax=Eurytemora carolleeae TaxID=1294199 RepID=UPI000C767CC1|nr:uncharacterized protein LOC111702221 [Eurytemora carolleeae]|eukprot:XP_023329604.1 uncharacterized protein LOC111702221 [Eurytemora affinis]